jgi:alcohol dehydrogenase
MAAQTTGLSATAQLNWLLPVHVRFGYGMLDVYQPEENLIVLADPNAVSTKRKDELSARWGTRLKAWVWQTSPETELHALSEISQEVWPCLSEHAACSILAIGGGTTLDTAKILRWRPTDAELCAQPYKLWRTGGVSTIDSLIHRHRLLCWPTTAGTGSEVSVSATIWDRSNIRPAKIAWQPAQCHADEAWVDPKLTISCPPKVTRDCALDALAHALEALWNRRSSILSGPLAFRAIELILENLAKTLADPANREARTALSEASLLAGMAMSETQTALAHALSYDLTLNEGLSHGESVAIWLPFVAELACKENPMMRQRLGAALRTRDAPADFLKTWMKSLGVIVRSVHDLPGGDDELRLALKSQRGANQLLEVSHAV